MYEYLRWNPELLMHCTNFSRNCPLGLKRKTLPGICLFTKGTRFCFIFIPNSYNTKSYRDLYTVGNNISIRNINCPLIAPVPLEKRRNWWRAGEAIQSWGGDGGWRAGLCLSWGGRRCTCWKLKHNNRSVSRPYRRFLTSNFNDKSQKEKGRWRQTRYRYQQNLGSIKK